MTNHGGSGARSAPGRLEYERAIRRSDLPPPSRHLALTIATWADIDTGVIAERFQPSLSTLEEATGLTRKTVRTHLDRLEAEGWIVRDRPELKKAQTEHARTRYSLALPPSPRGSDPLGLGEEIPQPRGSGTPAKGRRSPRARGGDPPKSPSQSHESLSLAERLVRDANVVAEDERENFINWINDTHKPNGPPWWRKVASNGDFAALAEKWRADQPTAAPKLPPWCGHCGDGNPAAEHNARWRKRDGQPCLDCHPDTRRSNTA